MESQCPPIDGFNLNSAKYAGIPEAYARAESQESGSIVQFEMSISTLSTLVN